MQNSKKYDLEERALRFARDIRAFIKKLPKHTSNIEDAKQLVRSSGSVGANYIEANESISKKDFLLRIKIARKEAKETLYWLRLIDLGGDNKLESECVSLQKEGKEILLILASILRKSE